MEPINNSVSQLIIDYIITAIKDGTFQAASRIPTEKELSEKFKVSRNSVREALKTLQFLGILVSNRGSGYRISTELNNPFIIITQLMLDMQNFTYKEISEIREALELKTFLLIQENSSISSNDLQFLKYCTRQMNVTSNAIQADLDFHNRLAKLSGNSLIYSITNALSKISQEYILIPWNDINEEETNTLIQSHINIIDALATPNKYPIIATNPISEHYKLADCLINKKNLLSQSTIHPNMPVSELASLDLTDEQLVAVIKNLRNHV